MLRRLSTMSAQDLAARITAQGAAVRALKLGPADPPAVAVQVALLKDLKAQLAALAGPPATAAPPTGRTKKAAKFTLKTPKASQAQT